MKRRKTLRERAEAYTNAIEPGPFNPRWWCLTSWLAGYRAGKKEGKAEAMKACGWGD